MEKVTEADMWIPNRMMMSLKLEVEDKTLNVVVLVRAFCPFFFCVVYIRVIYYFFLFLFWRTVKFSKSLFFFFCVCTSIYIYIYYIKSIVVFILLACLVNFYYSLQSVHFGYHSFFFCSRTYILRLGIIIFFL